MRIYLERPRENVMRFDPFFLGDARSVRFRVFIDHCVSHRDQTRLDRVTRSGQNPRRKAGFLQGVIALPGRIHVGETFGFDFPRELRSRAPGIEFVNSKEHKSDEGG